MEMINMDAWLFEFLKLNTVSTGLILGLLSVMFKGNRIVKYFNDKFNAILSKKR